MDERLRRRARFTVAAITAAFGLQLGYLMVAEEPYPALLMPRFGWAGPSQASEVQVPIPEITFRYADSSTKVLKLNELLAGIPDGHHGVIAGNTVAPLPAAAVVRRAPGRKLEPPGWLFPGYALARVSRTDPAHVASMRQWLRTRATEAYAGSPPVSCSVVWFLDTFRYDTQTRMAQGAEHREVSGRFDLDLDEPNRKP